MGWTGEGMSYTQATPNIYHQQLEFKVQEDGQLRKWDSLPLSLSADRDYWLRVMLTARAGNTCQATVM